ncbi:MAG: phosphoenolpyruvate mutase [Pseudomonadota bacterium]
MQEIARNDPLGDQPSAVDSRSKARQLRALINSPELEFLMEAHDGLSARIAQGAGFRGIWASGLSMSAALGVRDNNEASWTQVLEVLEFMSDATTVPILVDGDTGYGNFNNLRRAVTKLGQRDVAGICIEDKLFPKTNSFIGDGQPLADIDEFCGKIKAGKDSQTDPDFCLIARVEAFIAGWGLDEALKRAEAYRAAGADAILIHSKESHADEILTFAHEWANRAPLVIVPTKYYATPTDVFREARISVAIWANHSLRASITAMQEVCRELKRDETLVGVEERVVGVSEVFSLVGNDELALAEQRYLPTQSPGVKTVVLAATRGEKLGRLTEDRPKCMLDIRGQPLLRRSVNAMRSSGIRDITVVRGYRKEMVNLPSVRTVDNDLYATTGEASSLACARDQLAGESLIAYGDILYRQHILDRLLEHSGDIVLAVDALWAQRHSDDVDWVRDLVSCSKSFAADHFDGEEVLVDAVGHDLATEVIDGEWIGLVKLSAAGASVLRDLLDELQRDGRLPRASMFDLFQALLNQGQRIDVLYVAGHWLDVDDAVDLARAREFP